MWISKGPGIRSRKSEVGANSAPDFPFPTSYFRFFLALCLLLSAFSLFAMGGRYSVTEVKPHVFVWVPEEIHDLDGDPNFTIAGNSGFIIGPEGVIV
ncbi:MAG TPA: hypothetical protein VFM21_10740, partial [Terriglobia bacterium]|nr:hypothetical protein [Terriglobia bacterium]